jgi:hypothetical protein
MIEPFSKEIEVVIAVDFAFEKEFEVGIEFAFGKVIMSRKAN